MPKPDGTLTDEEFNRVVVKLFDLWDNSPSKGRPPCPSCGSEEFYIHPALFGNRSDTLSPMESHTRLPSVVVYCKNCGHVTEHVARVLGIEVLQTEGK